MSTSKRYSLVEQTSHVDPLQSPDDALNQSSSSSCKAATTHQAYSTPKILGTWDFHQWTSVSGDAILAIFPILFIVLAATAMSLDKKPLSALGHKVESAISISPTLFPIIFAAITGKFFKTLGLFWAERGITLGNLERLIGCQSLFAAVERQIALRSASLFGLAIILIWSLSPIGGQSALRLLNKSPIAISANSSVRYLAIEAASNSAMGGADTSFEGWPLYGPTFITALRTTRKLQNSTQDLFGNVKIPVLPISTSTDPPRDNDWTTVNYDEEVSYSSLFGVPVAGIPVEGNSSFQISSRYWTVTNCDIQEFHSFNASAAGFVNWHNSGSSFAMTQTDRHSVSPKIIDSVALVSMTSENYDNVSWADCDLGFQDIESLVVCQGQSCRVNASRPIATDESQRPAYGVFLGNAFSIFPLATIGVVHHPGVPSSSTLIEQWLMNTTADYQSFQWSNLSSLQPDVFDRNLGVAFNTFWQSTYASTFLTGNLSPNLSIYDNPLNQPGQIPFNASVMHTTSFHGDQYVCNRTFAGLLFLISCLLLVEAIASILLKSVTLSPDILGYVSSCTRDNPYLHVDEASHMDGLQRTRALQSVLVAIKDVNGGSDIGHIAFSSADKAQSLRKDRLYD